LLAKALMAQQAAGLVKDGDALVLDAGSTVYHLATLLAARRDLTVVTNGLEAALLLARNPSNKVILAANMVSPDGLTLVGNLHPDLLNHFHASKCFITCSGISLAQGLTETNVDEASLKSGLLKLARQVIALIDHSKFDKIDTYRFADLQQITHLITDEAIAPDVLTSFRSAVKFPITVTGNTKTETFEPGQAATQRRYRIGFGNITEKMIFAQQVRRSLQRVVNRFENIELLIRDNNLDPQTALDNADWFVEQAVDLVIEYQVDAKAGNVIMDKFNRAGIPVIAIDIPLPGATFYGADNYRAGYIAGEALGRWIKQEWAGQLDYLIKLELARVGPVAGARLQGQQEGLETLIGPVNDNHIFSIESPVIITEVEQAVQQILHEIPADVRVAVIAINDDAAVAALKAFERAERLQQVVAVGQNADRIGREAVRQPDFPFIGTTRFAPEKYGERIIDLALKLLHGKVVPPAVYNQHVFITRENIDDYYPELVEASLVAPQPLQEAPMQE
jgi:ribose transport system substrate-binding protein